MDMIIFGLSIIALSALLVGIYKESKPQKKNDFITIRPMYTSEEKLWAAKERLRGIKENNQRGWSRTRD
jgi:hypothetical protein